MKITLLLRCDLVYQFTVFFYVRIMLQMLFLQQNIFHDVRIKFCCGTFALHMEITLQLRFVFVRHCYIFLLCHNYIRLRFILVLSKYIYKERYKYVSFLLVIVRYVLLRYNYVVYLFDVVTIF